MAEPSEEAILEKQLLMTPVTWKTLQSHGVTEGTPLLIDLFWFAATEEAATSLATRLSLELRAPPTVGLVKDLWAVEAQYGPNAFSLDSLLSFVRRMCEIGFAHKCEFDGWGAQIPALPIKRKAWWRLW